MADDEKPNRVHYVDDTWRGCHGVTHDAWTGMVAHVVRLHGIPMTPAQLMRLVFFESGENPVFWAEGTPFVFKFYLQATNFLLEYNILDGISRHLPDERVLCYHYGSGAMAELPDNIEYIDDDERDMGAWCWPYSVVRFAHGLPLRAVLPPLTPPERVQLAKELGTSRPRLCDTTYAIARSVRRLHSVPGLALPFFRANQQVFSNVLKDIRAGCRDHEYCHSLPLHMLAQLEAYLPPAPEVVFSEPDEFRLCHGDINDRHCLLVVHTDDDRAGTRRLDLTGIIDFDSGGYFYKLYELVAVHIAVFGCDKTALAAFLQEYGVEHWQYDRLHGFARRAMVLTVLHKTYLLRLAFAQHPHWWQLKTLEELEDAMWGLDDSVFTCEETESN